jgi:hypothetical protein
MQDAKDQHNLAVDFIEYPVPAVDNATHQAAKSGLPRANLGMLLQSIKGFAEASRIGGSHVIAECLRTVIVDLCKVGPRLRAEPDLNHAARGARR